MYTYTNTNTKLCSTRIVLAYGCANDLLGISFPCGRWSTWLNSILHRSLVVSYKETTGTSQLPWASTLRDLWESRGRTTPWTRPLTLFLSANPQVRGRLKRWSCPKVQCEKHQFPSSTSSRPRKGNCNTEKEERHGWVTSFLDFLLLQSWVPPGPLLREWGKGAFREYLIGKKILVTRQY